MDNIFYFPGWTRKSITFTIDDGNVKLDAKFRTYTESAGFKGTFNLTTPLTKLTKDEYREFYKGYEIANHCRYHAYPFSLKRPKDPDKIKDELFDRETADRDFLYKTDEEGLYRNYTYAWTYIADDDKYMECVDSCQKELEEVFGKGTIRSYIWPCGEQSNENVFNMLKAYGFQSIRKTGNVGDSTNFAFPADRMRWSYNANYTDMTEVGAKYDAYPDDGELKFFCFGVHSHDFENNGKWDVLEDFCRKYGNRPNDFWYASVGELFDYEDAVKAAVVTDDGIKNPSDAALYAIVNGKKITVPAHGTVKF